MHDKEENLKACVATNPPPMQAECGNALRQMSPKEQLLNEMQGRESELIRKLAKLREIHDRIRYSDDHECQLASVILQLQWL